MSRSHKITEPSAQIPTTHFINTASQHGEKNGHKITEPSAQIPTWM